MIQRKQILPILTILIIPIVISLVYAQVQNPAENSKEVTTGEELIIPTPTPYPTLSPHYESLFKVVSPRKYSGRIAFATRIEGYSRILLLDLDSRRVRKVIEGPGNSSYPSWSPDGTKIAYTSDRDGNDEIYVADWNGENPNRLTFNKSSDANPSWSPDGKKVVYYSSSKNQRHTNLYQVGLDGSLPEKITKLSGRNTTPKWSTDGRQIAYSTNRFWPGWDVCTWNLHTKSESCLLTGTTSYCRPSWNNSGKTVVYSFGTFGDIDLGLLNIITGQKMRLTSLSQKEYDAVWSPDNKEILFVSDSEKPDVFNIFIVNTTTRKVSPILKSTPSIRYLSWTKAKTIELEAKRILELEKPIVEAPTEPTVATTPQTDSE